MIDMIASDMIIKAKCRLMICEPFYGHVSLNIDYMAHDMPWLPVNRRTMGVRIVNGGEVQCLYYPPFVESMSLEQLYAVIQHELEHVIRCHCVRIGDREAKDWNIATDMAVNGKRINPRIGFKDHKGHIDLPLDGDIIWIPDEWDDNETAEFYYDKIHRGGVAEDRIGHAVDNHDTWGQTELSTDEVRQLVRNIVVEASAKSMGNLPNHIQSLINQLANPVVGWRELLRTFVGSKVGGSKKTHSRRNRKNRKFGIKGISRHASSEANVIIDLSRSISQAQLEQFFSEVEAISRRCKIWLLLWDDQFRGYVKYRMGDWRKIKLYGRGGTDMAAPIEWLLHNHLVKDIQIMLTDGYCEYSTPKKMNLISVIASQDDNTQYPSWGRIVNM